MAAHTSPPTIHPPAERRVTFALFAPSSSQRGCGACAILPPSAPSGRGEPHSRFLLPPPLREDVALAPSSPHGEEGRGCERMKIIATTARGRGHPHTPLELILMNASSRKTRNTVIFDLFSTCWLPSYQLAARREAAPSTARPRRLGDGFAPASGA